MCRLRLRQPVSGSTISCRSQVLRFKNVPSRSSVNAWRNSSCVFITIGPYQATGSLSGCSEISKKWTPSSLASTNTSSPGPKSTTVWLSASDGGVVSHHPTSSVGTASGPEALQNFPTPEIDIAMPQPETSNLLGKISIQQCRKAEGEEKKQLLDQTMQSTDGYKVFNNNPSKLDSTKAKVIIHTLSDKNSLTSLGVSCIDNKTIFLWYIFAEPILENKINGGRLRTQAGIYSFRDDDQIVSLRSLSVNGS